MIPKAGTTLNVGVVHGGTVSNVVAARAVAQVDVRATMLDSAARDRASSALARAGDCRYPDQG